MSCESPVGFSVRLSMQVSVEGSVRVSVRVSVSFFHVCMFMCVRRLMRGNRDGCRSVKGVGCVPGAMTPTRSTKLRVVVQVR